MSSAKERERKAMEREQAFEAFQEKAHNALFGRIWVRWLVVAALVALTATSLVGMARMNGEVRPVRNMKWFMNQDDLVVAAPPLEGGFQAVTARP